MMNKEIKPFRRTDSVSNMIIRNSKDIVIGCKKLVKKNSFFKDLMDVMENARKAEEQGEDIIHMEVGQPGPAVPKKAQLELIQN